MYEGMTVVHGKFGSGTVVALEDNRIRVQFAAEGEKAFPYPDSFEKFLKFVDDKAQSEVMDELEGKKNADEKALRERTIMFRQKDLERRKERKEKAKKAKKLAQVKSLPVTEAQEQASGI
ncbi:MAG: hypothetical protein K6F92_01405 [Lachnospiraceae bacterium]|nr:hypothetical protein [Lachnospiraceae bacterium]